MRKRKIKILAAKLARARRQLRRSTQSQDYTIRAMREALAMLSVQLLLMLLLILSALAAAIRG